MLANQILEAKDMNTPISRLLELSYSKNEILRISVCVHPNLPFTRLSTMVLTDINLVRWAILDNPSLSPEQIEELYSGFSEDMLVLIGIGRHVRCPVKILMKMVRSKLWSSRAEAAFNPTLNLWAARKLMKDSSDYVRLSLVNNNTWAGFVSTNLWNDPSDSVRMEVARSRHTTLDILLKMLDDKNPDVRSKVKYSISMIGRW